ncbi:MAG: hypothetical protein ACODAU_11300 [Myxococcota bacterium]
MTDLLLYRLLHFVGNIFWLGGVVSVGLVGAGLAGASERSHAAPLRRTALTIATPGMVLAWLGGLGMLLPAWGEVYARAGWMHGKITLALIAAALTGVLTGRLRRAANGTGELKPGLLRGLSWTVLVLALLTVGLAVLRPGA